VAQVPGCRVRLRILAIAGVAWLTAAAPASGQRGWEVHGKLTGVVTGWPGAVIAIPVLRVGTIAGGRGTFKLRSTAPGGCYEAIVRTQRRHLTHLWFSAPESGYKDLGDIEIAELPRDWDLPLDAPAVHDTIRGCQPERFSDEITWPSVHATLVGQLLRGRRPLAKVPIDLGCGVMPSIRTHTDSGGKFRFSYPLSFPDDQSLADGGEADCHLSVATITLDEPRRLTLTFGPHSARAPEHQILWRLPEPDLRPRRIIEQARGRDAPLRMNGTVSFSPGVLTAAATVGLQLMDRPKRVELFEAGACSFPTGASRGWNWQRCAYRMGRPIDMGGRELLPVALRVTTGQQQATTGSHMILAVPAAYAARVAAGERFEAFARLPARYKGPLNAFTTVSVSYSPSLQTLSWSLSDFHFDDDRTRDHAYEAMIVLVLHHQQTRQAQRPPE
jgi:hypothetical protein